MRVLDFDNTIYNGESVLDFYIYSLHFNPRAIKLIFPVMSYALRYKLGKMTVEQLEKGCVKYAHDYIASFADPDKMVVSFWDSHMKKIKKWYEPQENDVILTASFNVIMDEVCRRLGVRNCICSVINRETLNVEYLNFNKNKKDSFYRAFGTDAVADEFYTDNISDLPMIEIARKAYLVHGSEIKRIK
ncbi:MAG TPA: haloacid dehalogenase-like hydrolase [Candidatus Eubacterium faecavium]|nr:haloacid dehalogenase-like hydrolase [Candidatus Eubacterium faecavium]